MGDMAHGKWRVGRGDVDAINHKELVSFKVSADTLWKWLIIQKEN